MAFYGKVFAVESDENIGEFVRTLELPEDKAQKLLQYKPKQKIEKNDDDYAFTVFTDAGNKVFKFKSGQEFADTLRDVNVKITITIDGNKNTHVIKVENGTTLTVKREYTDNSLSEEISHSKWNGVARRFYKAE